VSHCAEGVNLCRTTIHSVHLHWCHVLPTWA